MNTVSNSMSILGLFAQADIVVKFIMLLLIALSVTSWAIIFEKYSTYSKLKVRIARFEENFWSGQLLSQLYEKMHKRIDNPLAAVFVAAMKEWSYVANRTAPSANPSSSDLRISNRINMAMQVAANKELESINKNLPFLAVVGSASPFIGIFGTVWGIMHSFQSIAAMKNATIAVVAPGIAEALLAAAIGLFAAIPAVIFYNLLTLKVEYITSSVESFSSELSSLLSRQLDNAVN